MSCDSRGKNREGTIRRGGKEDGGLYSVSRRKDILIRRLYDGGAVLGRGRGTTAHGRQVWGVRAAIISTALEASPTRRRVDHGRVGEEGVEILSRMKKHDIQTP